MSIEGKVVLVTGAGQGIGRAIELRPAKDGAYIAIVDVNEKKTSEVAEEVKALGRKATTYKADVTRRDDVYGDRPPLSRAAQILPGDAVAPANPTP